MRLNQLAVLCVVVMLAGCKRSYDDNYVVLPAVGTAAPAFRYATLAGGILTDESLRGTPSVVALWSSKCSVSRLALASLGALDADYAGRARVVILADDADRSAVAPLVAQAGVRAPVALAAGTLMQTFTHDQSALPWRKAFGLPTFLVFDRAGHVVHRQVGIEPDQKHRMETVRALLDSLLSHPPAAAFMAPAV